MHLRLSATPQRRKSRKRREVCDLGQKKKSYSPSFKSETAVLGCLLTPSHGQEDLQAVVRLLAPHLYRESMSTGGDVKECPFHESDKARKKNAKKLEFHV